MRRIKWDFIVDNVAVKCGSYNGAIILGKIFNENKDIITDISRDIDYTLHTKETYEEYFQDDTCFEIEIMPTLTSNKIMLNHGDYNWYSNEMRVISVAEFIEEYITEK